MGQPGLLFSEDLHWALPPGFQFILTAPPGCWGVLSFSWKPKPQRFIYLQLWPFLMVRGASLHQVVVES